jgi:hypothetical protein
MLALWLLESNRQEAFFQLAPCGVWGNARGRGGVENTVRYDHRYVTEEWA